MHASNRLIAAGLLLLVVLLFSFARCQSPDSELNVEGATVINVSPSELRLHAYSPAVVVEGVSAGTRLVVENISAQKATANTDLGEVPVNPLTATSLAVEIGRRAPKRLEISTRASQQIVFAVIGDSQGRNDILTQAVSELNNSKLDFLIHLGDMVPSGREDEYQAFLATMAELEVPFYTVPGNHDTRNSGCKFYQDLLGPLHHYFDFKGYRFIFLDSSSLGIDNKQLAWLDGLLDSEQPTFVFLHVPPKDPRGKDHGFVNQANAEAFLELIGQKPVQAVFTGHVHMFNQKMENGVPFITSGGGGASLYAPPDKGGFHHFLLATVGETGLSLEVKHLEERQLTHGVTLKKGNVEIFLANEDVLAMDWISGSVSYQNRFGNYCEEAEYRGVKIRDLVSKVGGMEPGDNLVIAAKDGYSQEYCYENVYSEESSWGPIQGTMILATHCDGQSIPGWKEGYRVAFLPEDGQYDNDDCKETSGPGQGWHQYKSAGARFIRNVVRLEVIPCQK